MLIVLLFSAIAIYLAFQVQKLRKEREDRLYAIVNTSMDALIQLDDKGRVIGWNKAATDIFGWQREEILGNDLEKFIIPVELQKRHRTGMQRFLSTGNPQMMGKRVELPAMHRDGRRLTVELSLSCATIRGRTEFSAFIRDITERKKTEENLRIAAATFESHEAILVTDPEAKIIRANRAFELSTGFTAEEVIGMNPRLLSSGRQDAAFYEEMWAELVAHGRWSGELWDRHKDGRTYPKYTTISAVKDDKGKVAQYVAIFSDISERKRFEAEIENLAYYDALTQLPNRRMLMERLSAVVSSAARSRHYGALMFMDLDNFKTLNDTLGHHYGDELLVQIAKRLSSSVRAGDVVARFGGDEFVMLFENLSLSEADATRRAATIAENIRHTVTAPYQIEEHTQHSSPSIGVCMFRDKEDIQDLIKRADIAMYQAKESGKNQVRFYDPSLQKMLEYRASLDADMRKALPRGEFHLHYQLQVNERFDPLGAEALLRWKHPEHGFIPPAEFIPLAEETGFIFTLGDWILETACKQLAAWSKNEATRHLTLAVNVSAKQFRQADFVGRVADIVRSFDFDPTRLKLEITESVALGDQDFITEKIRQLKDRIGVLLSLDDFGTGYSSLSYLKRLPFDQIKIDQSFVRDLVADADDEIVVHTIINLAQNFKMRVIAEGVETWEQVGVLRHYGCSEFQGYLFSKPVAIDDLHPLLAERPWKAQPSLGQLSLESGSPVLH